MDVWAHEWKERRQCIEPGGTIYKIVIPTRHIVFWCHDGHLQLRLVRTSHDLLETKPFECFWKLLDFCTQCDVIDKMQFLWRLVHMTSALVHLTPALVHLTPALVHLAPALVHLACASVHLAFASVHFAHALVHLAFASVHLASASVHLASASVHLASTICSFPTTMNIDKPKMDDQWKPRLVCHSQP